MLFCCSVAKLCLTLCDPMGSRLLCPPLSPGLCSNSCLLSCWCYLTISSSATLFSFYLQSFPISGAFPVRRLFASGGQSIRTSASVSVLPMNTQHWFPLGLTGLIPLLSKLLLRIFSSTTVQKQQFFRAQPSLWSNSYIHTWLQEKPKLWLDGPLSAKRYLCFLIQCLGLAKLFFQGASVF